MTMMTMMALVFKILIMMMMMTIVVMGKMITIKMIRITQVNEKIMMMIENGRFSRTLDLEKLCESLVGP